jgi:hypothetical protein
MHNSTYSISHNQSMLPLDLQDRKCPMTANHAKVAGAGDCSGYDAIMEQFAGHGAGGQTLDRSN